MDIMRIVARKDDIHTRIHTLMHPIKFSGHGENVGKFSVSRNSLRRIVSQCAAGGRFRMVGIRSFH